MENLTDQQKLEILCAYLPHGVEVRIKKRVGGVSVNRTLALTQNSISSVLPFNPKLILRHSDDMTEEENAHKMKLWSETTGMLNTAIIVLRYLHSIHIDTFGAIEAGFAVRKNINETQL